MRSDRYAKIRSVSAVDRADVRSKLESLFSKMTASLQDLQTLSNYNIRQRLKCATFIKSNRNGSLDAELHIVGVARGPNLINLLQAIKRSMIPIEDTFVAMSILFRPTDGSGNEDDSGGFSGFPNLPKFRGTYYAKTRFWKNKQFELFMLESSFPLQDRLATSEMPAALFLRNAIAKRKKKPDVIVIRYNWNPIDQCPSRHRKPTISLHQHMLKGLPLNLIRFYRKLMDDREEQDMTDELY